MKDKAKSAVTDCKQPTAQRATTNADSTCAGWGDINTLNMAKPANSNPKKYVRFHVLNADAGGPAAAKNLTSTTQMANHYGDWREFEADLDNKIRSGADHGLYPPSHFRTVPYWKKYSDDEHKMEDVSGTSWS